MSLYNFPVEVVLGGEDELREVLIVSPGLGIIPLQQVDKIAALIVRKHHTT